LVRSLSVERPVLVSNTATGRATIRRLAINHPDNIAQRQAFIAEGVFQPPKSYKSANHHGA